MTFSASAGCKVQSNDPRLLSLMVLVDLEVDVNCANAFSKPLRNSAGSTLASKMSTTPFAMLATSNTPSQNSMMSPVFSAEALENAKISFRSFTSGTATISKKSLYATLPQSFVTLYADSHFLVNSSYNRSR